jgi:hypothetical protein
LKNVVEFAPLLGAPQVASASRESGSNWRTFGSAHL